MSRQRPTYRVTLCCAILTLGVLVVPSSAQQSVGLSARAKRTLIKASSSRGISPAPSSDPALQQARRFSPTLSMAAGDLHKAPRYAQPFKKPIPSHRAASALMKRLQPSLRTDNPGRITDRTEVDNGLTPVTTVFLERYRPPVPMRTLTVRVYAKDPADFLTDEKARYPLPNAAVEISPVDTGEATSWTSLDRSGSEGEVQKRLRAGQYRVTVSKPGYYWLRPGSSRSTTVDVYADRDLIVVLRKDRDHGMTDLSVTRGEYWFLYQQYYYVHDDYYGRDELVDYGDWRRFAGPFRTQEDLRDWKEDNAPLRASLRAGYNYREESRETWVDEDTSWQ